MSLQTLAPVLQTRPQTRLQAGLSRATKALCRQGDAVTQFFANSLFSFSTVNALARKVRIITAMIKLKRAYEKPTTEDGLRILVERLWPRGLTNKRAAVDLWLREVAPTSELRRWFGHDPARWEEFQKRYRRELRGNKEAVKLLKQKAKQGTVTLVYAARDEQHNGALVLKRFLSPQGK
jgi:uncharacterized protein YeaO (DUF488 family)